MYFIEQYLWWSVKKSWYWYQFIHRQNLIIFPISLVNDRVLVLVLVFFCFQELFVIFKATKKFKPKFKAKTQTFHRAIKHVILWKFCWQCKIFHAALVQNYIMIYYFSGIIAEYDIYRQIRQWRNKTKQKRIKNYK